LQEVVVRKILVGAVAVCLASSAYSFADFQYSETTTITGGSIVGVMKMAGTFSKQARQANEPIISTVLIQGNRMARINTNYSEIVDLDKETITHIDNQKKTYTVMTFEEMRQHIAEAARKSQERQHGHVDPQAAKNPDEKVDFHVNVRNTSNTKDVAGLKASEAILTMAVDAQNTKTGEKGNIAITNDMWMAPEVPGYAEVRDFQKKYAQKMGAVFNEAVSPAMLASMQPGSSQGMSELAKEMSKLKGTPVLQIMRLGSTTDGKPLPAASEAPLPESNSPAMPSAGDVAKESVTSSISSKLGGLGGLGGFGHKKKKEEPAPEQKSGDNAQPQAAVLVESKTELTSFSRDKVDATKFNVPAGYKQVEARNSKGE
jgi:hypothetical protein